MRDQQLDIINPTRAPLFCENIADLQGDARLSLKAGVSEDLLSDRNYRDLTMDNLLSMARNRGWSLDKIQRVVGTRFDRATIIALIKN